MQRNFANLIYQLNSNMNTIVEDLNLETEMKKKISETVQQTFKYIKLNFYLKHDGKPYEAKFHVRFRAGENLKMTSKDYLSLCARRSYMKSVRTSQI